jgi:hypothetical protein
LAGDCEARSPKREQRACWPVILPSRRQPCGCGENHTVKVVFSMACRNILTNGQLVSNSGTRSGRVGTSCTPQKIRVHGAPEPRRCAAGLRRAARGAMQCGVSLGAAVRCHRHQSDLHQFHISIGGRYRLTRFWRGSRAYGHQYQCRHHLGHRRHRHRHPRHQHRDRNQ